MTDRIYAIGDIHGQHEMLVQALARIERDGGAAAQIVFLGDLVDRGAGSRAVIETIIQGQAEGRDWTALAGNHDRLFLNYLLSGELRHARLRSKYDWLHEVMGGRTTLASYGVDTALEGDALLEAARAAVPQAHVVFLQGCPTCLDTEEIYFVHAGVNPRLPLEWQGEDDQTWIREPFLEHKQPFVKLIVHGHTSVEEAEHCGNRVNLDSGAGRGRPLTAAVFEAGRVFALEDSGRRELVAG